MSEHELEKAQEMRKAKLDPLMQKSIGQLLLDIPKRALALVNKMLGMETSFRLLGFGTATYLVMGGFIGGYIWIIAVIFLIFGKEGLDTVKDIKK